MKLRIYIAFAALLICGAAAAVQESQTADDTARLLAEFRARVNQYVEVRKKAAKDSPRLKETKDPAKITEAQLVLADRIRVLRIDSRPGDIFTPEIQPLFRRLLAPEMKGETGRDTKAVINSDAPPVVPLKINEKYPDKEPLPTVPANILTTLPPLPKELEYRLVKKNLLLLDPEAELIIDYMPNAIR